MTFPPAFSRRRAPHGRGVAKAAWVEVGGKRFYARSKMEHRYALYLQWRKEHGGIDDWHYAPDVFYFGSLRRGVTNYRPDFKIEAGGEVSYVETKGWLDARSRTALKRMAKYHPGVKLTLIDSGWFKSNAATLAALVPGWMEV